MQTEQTAAKNEVKKLSYVPFIIIAGLLGLIAVFLFNSYSGGGNIWNNDAKAASQKAEPAHH